MSNSSVILNSTNIVNSTTNNVLRLKFPNSVSFTGKEQVALASFSCYYSWFNIDAQAYKNTQYSYVWVDGNTYSVNMPNINADSASALNAYLQSVMVSNGHYLINTTSGDYIYYLEIVENPSFYAIQLNCYAMPTVITGYAYPAGATWTLTGTGDCPQFGFLPQATSNFNLVVGFDADTVYPATPQNTTYSVTSVFPPEINPVSALQLTCNLISNKFSSNNQNLYVLGIPSVSFGQEIVVYPPNFAYNRINASTQYFIEVQITDQNGNPVYLQDPQILVLLTINDGGLISK